MINIIEQKNCFELHIQYDYMFKHNVSKIKEIPGARYNPLYKIWVTPLTSRSETEQLKFSCKAVMQKAEQQAPEITGAIPELAPLTAILDLKDTVILRPYQQSGIQKMIDKKRCMNGDEPGLGKAQPGSVKISTPVGFKYMRDIQMWDKINGADGAIYEVNGVYPQGQRDVYKVTFNDGFHTFCDMEHLWQVRDQNRRLKKGNWIVKTLKDILENGIENKTNDKRELSGRKPSLKWEIPITEPVNKNGKKYVIDPYIFGALLGDGSTCGKVIQISIPDTEVETAERIKSLLPGDFNLYENRHPKCPQYSFVRPGTTHKNPFKSEIKRLKINVKGGQKFIPDYYKNGSIKQRIELLKGLMDTDGSCKKNRTTFHTKSTLLAYDISELVQSLGGIAIVRKYDRTHHNKGFEYQVNIRTNFCPFHLKAKADNWSLAKSFLVTRYIEKIEYIGVEQMQCISVTAPDKLYLTDNYIVTHNTIQTIAALSHLKKFPAVIICPASLKLNWMAEIKKFSHLRAMVLTDKIKSNWLRFFETGLIDVFIVNYESLAKYFILEMPDKSKLKHSKNIIPKVEWAKVQAVAIDESHRLKNPTTKQTKIALRLCHNKEVVFLLTGTPVVNKPIDLYPQLAIMGRLEQFGGRAGFVKRYCDGGQGATNLRELNYYMNVACYFGRKKKEVLQDLPDKQRQTFICDISTRTEYDFAKREFVSWLKSTGCDDAAIRRKLRGEILVKMNVLRQISARGKIDAVIDYVDEIIGSGEKVVLFCTLREIIAKIRSHYPQAVSIDGSLSESQRDYNKTAFQNNSACNIIVCNIKAGGVGLTLTASSRVGFIEFPWTWADCVQCEDRTHRIGQKESVMCTYFFGERTIDARMFDIIQDKKVISDAVVGGSDEIPMNMVDKMISLFTETE